MPRRTHVHARLFAASIATAALVATGLAMPLAAQAASFDVDTVAEFETAFENSAGGDIRLTAPIDAHTGSFEQADGITVSVDLNGFDLSVNSLVGGNGSFLLLTDSAADGGTLTATATYGLNPAIFTALSETHIDGTIRVEASGTVNQPGIGGSTNGVGTKHDGGSIVIEGQAVVVATGGSTLGTATPAAAGIGGSQTGKGPNLLVGGSAQVFAAAGFADVGQRSGAGIGGGVNGDGNYVDIKGDAQVTAIGRNGGAGIGSGAKTSQGVGGGTVLIGGNAKVTARTEGLDPDGFGGAGIGGGSRDLGATVTASGTAVVDATGGSQAAAIGGGYHGNGKSFVSSGASSVTAKSSINAIGYGTDAATPALGTVTIGAGTTLTIPANGKVTVPASQQLTNNGTILNSGALTGAGKIVNNGTIVDHGPADPTVPIWNHNYQIQLEATPGDLPPADAIKHVYAASPALGGVTLPTPTRSGYAFTGWNSAPDGSGTTITDASIIAGAPPAGLGSSTGAPIIGVLHAQYAFIKLASAASVSVPSATYGTAPIATAILTPGATGPVGYAIDGESPAIYAQANSGAVQLPATLPVGAHTLTISYPGDSTYLGTTATATFAITSIPTTTTAVLSASTVTTGSPVSITPTLAGGGTGTIVIGVDGTAVGSVSSGSPLALPALTVGSHTIAANYAGDATHAASSVSLVLTVIAAPMKAVTPKVTVTTKKFAKNHKPKITVTISALGAVKKASGKIAIYVGKKKVKTVTITNKTVVRVTLPKRYSTTIKVTARFTGSAAIGAASSKTVKVRAR